jgi:hypothetical protein
MITPGFLLGISSTRVPRALLRNALHKRNTRHPFLLPSDVVLRTRLAVVKGHVVGRADAEFALDARDKVGAGRVVDLARGAAAVKK